MSTKVIRPHTNILRCGQSRTTLERQSRTTWCDRAVPPGAAEPYHLMRQSRTTWCGRAVPLDAAEPYHSGATEPYHLMRHSRTTWCGRAVPLDAAEPYHSGATEPYHFWVDAPRLYCIYSTSVVVNNGPQWGLRDNQKCTYGWCYGTSEKLP